MISSPTPAVGSERDSFARRAGGFAAFVITASLGILAASPEPYWLDSPELTAAVQTLGMPHPPGHPFFVMLTKVFTLLPFGSIAFRVSFASAVFGALGIWLLYHICLAVLERSVPTVPERLRVTAALGAALLAAVTPVFWAQCVRQEVYALQALLLTAALLPLVRFCLDREPRDVRGLYVSAFFFGLALCNHPVIAAAFFPAVLPLLVSMARSKGGAGAVRFALSLFAVSSVGLLPYVMLPLRAASGAAVSLGGVHSPADFLFVVFGSTYSRAMSAQYFETGGRPVTANLLESLGEIGLPLLIGAALGCTALLRARRTRLAGLFIALSIFVPLLLRAVTGFDLFMPDYRGYLAVPVGISAVAFAVFVGVTLKMLRFRLKQGAAVAAVTAAALLVLPVVKARESRPKVSLAEFRAGRLFTDFCLDRAVPGTLVLPSNYNMFFNLSAGRYIDGNRPDLTVVNPELLHYPGYLNRTLAELPALAPLARSMLVKGALGESALAEVALHQPLRAEPAWKTDEAALRYLLPDGPLYRASPQPAAVSDVEIAAEENGALMRDFYHLLGTSWQEPETRRTLFGVHYRDALFSARAGDRKGATEATDAALLLIPKAPRLLALKADLESAETGPLDIAPYLPSAPLETPPPSP